MNDTCSCFGLAVTLREMMHEMRNFEMSSNRPITNLTAERPKILIVDDEPQIRALLQEFLGEYFQVTLGSTGKEAVELARRVNPDVILMDVMMPEMDGISACDQIRNATETQHIPILMLTAANTSMERIRAFNGGADDFISKPFEFDELLARLHAKIKRAKQLGKQVDTVYDLANLKLNVQNREVLMDSKLIDLSPSEFGILHLLLSKNGSVVSRKEIMDFVWEDQSKNDRLIDAHVTSLRKKIAGFSGEIQTVYGAGYRIKANA
jgi:DNA-binding response OmpR family regulator